MLDRRQFLSLGAGALALGALPRFALASSSLGDTRFLLVFLRGGLDGLHALQAYGDPAYASLRGGFAKMPGQPASHALDEGFALHGSLGFLAELYAGKQLLPVVAVAPPYRKRSHFQAQDCVENGLSGSGGSSGWLNRCIAALPGGKGLALSAVMPLAMRGGADVSTWSPPLRQEVDPVLFDRLRVLYAADPRLAGTFSGIDAGMEGSGKPGAAAMRLPQSMAAAARFMAAENGPRIGFVEDTGWDTHNNELSSLGRKLKELDAGLKAFHDGARPIWRNTVVAVVTEFGRTAAINGTGGTDHGIGGVAFLAGGGVAGGRIAGDWPGLGKQQLNDSRDLRATTDLRSMFKGILREHLEIADTVLTRSIFPDSAQVAPMRDLARTG